MSLTAGIVGLPNVGKSTLFNAITNQKILAENYPFATIEPNVGVVTVPDERMDKLKEMYEPNRFIPTAYEFTDIAGLVKGASQGEGLGNKFLSHIREVDAIVEVVRCFDDGKIIHVDGNIDPIRDIETINLELAIADLDVINNRLERVSKKARTTKNKDDLVEVEALEKAKQALEENKALRQVEFTEDELKSLKSYSFLTLKPIIYLANIKESELGNPDNKYVQEVKQYASKHAEILAIEEASSKLNNWRLDGCDVYITLEPCPMCASALKQARVSHIFCGLSNSDFRNYEIVLKILESDKNNASVPIINDLAVEKVDKIMKDFFRNRRNS